MSSNAIRELAPLSLGGNRLVCAIGDRTAAARPEITALSMSAGNPVCTQSPARNRLPIGVRVRAADEMFPAKGHRRVPFPSSH